MFDWCKNDVNNTVLVLDNESEKCHSLKQKNAIQKVDRESIVTRCHSTTDRWHGKKHSQHSVQWTTWKSCSSCCLLRVWPIFKDNHAVRHETWKKPNLKCLKSQWFCSCSTSCLEQVKSHSWCSAVFLRVEMNHHYLWCLELSRSWNWC